MDALISRELLVAAGIILLLVIATGAGALAESEIALAFVAAGVIMLGVFGVLIRGAGEEPPDGRDRRTGDRAAFFTAAGVLMAGTLVEWLTASPIDTWLLAALAAALVAKSIGFLRRRK